MSRKNTMKKTSMLNYRMSISEKVFIKLIRNENFCISLIKAYTFLSNNEIKSNKIFIDGIEFIYKIEQDNMHIEDIVFRNFCENKFKIKLTNHFCEQVLERRLKFFDWSLLCNVLKDVISGNHKDGYKYEITNGISSCIFSCIDNEISIITAWNGVR